VAGLIASRQGAVLQLLISNPSARNALHPDIYREGLAALEEARTDPDIRAMVLAGEGKHFCAGGNLNRLLGNRSQAPEVQARSIDSLHEWVVALRAFPKPVIAAVEGAAAGAGFSLALGCDMIVAASDARFVMSYIRVGLTPDGGGSYWLGTRLPYPLAYEMLATGAPVSAQRLHALGLVNEITEPGQALPVALARARALADGPSFALAGIKSLLTGRERQTLTEHLARERDSFVAALFHEDAGEGIAAFLEKRAPRYRGPNDQDNKGKEREDM
jgi:enoyl-CoA hydratase/carnithine racemase